MDVYCLTLIRWQSVKFLLGLDLTQLMSVTNQVPRTSMFSTPSPKNRSVVQREGVYQLICCTGVAVSTEKPLYKLDIDRSDEIRCPRQSRTIHDE
jgi:hypothetical protein